MKKIISMAAALMLVGALLVGCGEVKPTETPPITPATPGITTPETVPPAGDAAPQMGGAIDNGTGITAPMQ